MNFIQKFVNWGMSLKEWDITDEHLKSFLLSRDLCATVQYMFFIKYHQIPSIVSWTIHEESVENCIKFLAEKNFYINLINARMGRHSSCAYTVGNEESKIMINFDLSDSSDPSEEDDKLVDVTICFDGNKSGNLPFEIIEKFAHNGEGDTKGKILFFEKDSYGEIVLNPYKVASYDLDIADNYNDDFLPVHEKVVGWLGDFSQNNNKLVLFHGVPGSGKTNYIKYLLSQSPEVNKIYIPPHFVQSMADPAFLPIIRREKKSVLIIEDAEKILSKREHTSDNSLISILLNLCDGIMASVLDFKIIATFNVDEDLIDDALKRRGRMFLKYKFDALNEEKTKTLFRKVHNCEPEKKTMTLSEIYNPENNFSKKPEPAKMGFGF